MIDLSFLTAEEQEIILTVLKRDAELKKTEEQRVQNLQKTVNDRGQLRYLTGKWFYETKQLRHQDRIHGSDIIRASMRHTDKPISILELSQILPEKSSFVSSENKEVFVPPILCGLLLEPHRQLSHEGDENLNISTAPRDISALELQSPTKQRKNPFNSEPSDTCLFDRAVDQTKTQSQEPFPSSNSSISYASSVRQDPSNPVSQHPAVTMAMPEDIAVSTSLLDCSVEEEGSSSRESNSTALQGILKYLSTSNTTDSPFPHLNQQDPVSVDSPAETWIDRKQVSFSTMVSHNGKEWQDEKELGGCSLLDTDSVTSCEIKDSLLNNNDLENSGRRATGTYKLLLRIPNDLQEGELICKNDSDFRDQEAGQHQVHSGVSQQFHQELLSPAGSPLASAEQASGYDDSSSPVMSDVKCLSSRSMSSTKSLENVTSISRDDKTKNISTDQINLVSPLSSSKQIKSNVSLPVLQQDKTNSDSTFESNLDWTKNTGSSTSNISLSSGMASMLSASSSISSLHLADFNDVEVQGSIQFAVNYIQKLGEFHIFVVHCRELAVADTKKNCSDPYVKCYLLPGKTKLGKKKTTVKKKTLNPTYNEILRFKVTMEVLKTQSLNISVWHNNTFGRKSFLGEVDLDLSEWDFSNTQINEYTLKARVSPQTSVLSSPQLIHGRGQMRVALRFLPQASHNKRSSRMETGEVQIWVKDCKNLPSFKGVIIDPFVRCTVLPDTSRKSCQKTRVVKRTVSPMFNHTMVYDGFRIEDLREACVEMTVWDHDRLSSRYIGGLRLGLGTGKSYGVDVPWMDSTIDEAHLWQRMLQSDGEWAEDILPLRGLMMVKCMPK
ncbi:synaptotagmin-like protein 2 isoform X8 [Echeneis naucrates]|uniref:synaptotagmin-like protein 2 isoform X8 n=1 Tax=Echeneis naucrates TaxID=173247 RepID=UPI0011140036|nr:synaptotagmin-like protein 2 isoform X8 [Echeneis naucrates]